MVRNNTFKRNGLIDGRDRAQRGDPFPTGAIYVSESGGDTRAGSLYAAAEITGNYFENNWDGIVLWENADRFCRPDEPFDTTNGCPFFDQTWGTRYKTQNITIQGNEFWVDRQAIGCTNALCGRMALFSNYGTYPANSPYLGDVVQNAVTFQQNNFWLQNAYHGPWRFVPFEMGHNFSFAAWQAAPYNQDGGSTFDGDMGPPDTPPPSPPPGGSPANFLDADTSDLEGSIGKWAAWYSATAARSASEAHGGTYSLRVDVTQPYGWGVALTNHPGFAATPGSKRVSIWGKLGSGSVRPTLTVKWLGADRAELNTDRLVLPMLTATWQNATMLVEAPAGTRTVLTEITGRETAGSYMYFDDIVVGDAENALDPDTGSLEGSVGEWRAWYSTSVSSSADQSYSGTRSLLNPSRVVVPGACRSRAGPGFPPGAVPSGSATGREWACPGSRK
jgi:hypothetical protein